MKVYTPISEGIERQLVRMSPKIKFRPVIVAVFAVVVFCFPASFVVDADAFRRLAGERGPIQISGAVLFLVASAGFFALYLRSSTTENSFIGRRTKRNVYWGLLAVLMFVCFGEEASWGQHLIGFGTPGILSGLNAQNETNLHNLWLFHQWRPDGSEKSFLGLLINMNRLFSIFWLTYFVVVPISANRSHRVRRTLKSAGIPIPPIWVGWLFLASFVSYKIFAFVAVGSLRAFPLDELKEASYAAIFAFFAMYSLAIDRPLSLVYRRKSSRDVEWPDDDTNPELVG